MARVITSDDESEIIYKVSRALKQVEDSMCKHSPHLMPHKSQAIIMKNPRKWDTAIFEIAKAKLKKTTRYLGGGCLSFGHHTRADQ